MATSVIENAEIAERRLMRKTNPNDRESKAGTARNQRGPSVVI